MAFRILVWHKVLRTSANVGVCLLTDVEILPNNYSWWKWGRSSSNLVQVEFYVDPINKKQTHNKLVLGIMSESMNLNNYQNYYDIYKQYGCYTSISSKDLELIYSNKSIIHVIHDWPYGCEASLKYMFSTVHRQRLGCGHM